MIPDYLTRYYVAGEYPFTSLNDLPLEEANAIKMAASDKYEWGGFYAQYDYLIHRREIEKWIHRKMCEMGGNPMDDIPVYMFLGDVNGKFDKFGADTASLRIPLHEIDLSAVSFVWPDSMYEMVVDGNGDFTGAGKRTNTPKVYMYHELDEVAGLVSRYNAVQGKKVPAACIEAQVWDRKMLEKWYRSRTKQA